MPVPADRARFIHDAEAGGENAPEHFVIAAGSRLGARIERFVEGPDLLQYVAAQSHVGACTRAGDGDGIVACAVEEPPLEAAAERTETLEPLLRFRFELQRQRQARRAHHSGIGKGLDQRAEPLRLWSGIVIGECDDG